VISVYFVRFYPASAIHFWLCLVGNARPKLDKGIDLFQGFAIYLNIDHFICCCCHYFSFLCIYQHAIFFADHYSYCKPVERFSGNHFSKQIEDRRSRDTILMCPLADTEPFRHQTSISYVNCRQLLSVSYKIVETSVDDLPTFLGFCIYKILAYRYI